MFKKRMIGVIVATVLMHSMGVSAHEMKSSPSSSASQIQDNQASTWLDQESYLRDCTIKFAARLAQAPIHKSDHPYTTL